MDQVDVLVIGAGVVGLACARALAQAGLEVIVAEQATAYGTGVSARNSEVVHAGLYHAAGSLKARLCVRGRALLYDYCAARGVAVRRCGKLVVATRPQDVAALEALQQRGRDAGVDDLALLSRAQALTLEPELVCSAALHSPSSGIVDSHGFMSALLGDAERAGASLALTSGVVGAQHDGAHWCVQVQVPAAAAGGAGERFELRACWIVNAAGLGAQAVAAAMHGFPAAAIPAQHLAKGHYFALPGRAPFSRLIYPTPVDGGLGVHLTLDLGGQARFGPDVEWLAPRPCSAGSGAVLDFAVDGTRATAFEAEVRRYWPRLPTGAMAPAYAGIRPKLSGPGQAAADFRIDGPAEHGCPGAVQLFGIESPGLTASMAIAEWVVGLVTGREAPA
jgi:L-2-hydroxyglutarate oxidase LhgO